jgi:uncharacterized membrane protein YedE/YeeE
MLALKQTGAAIIVGGFFATGLAHRVAPHNAWLNKFWPLIAFGFMFIGAIVGAAGMIVEAIERHRARPR